MRHITLRPLRAVTRPLLAIALAGGGGMAAAAESCPPAPEPVISLDYGSRYIDDDASRSTVDARSNAEVNKALKPVDNFIRDLVSASNAVLRDAADLAAARAGADCVVAQIATWAAADAMFDLDSFTARLSSGSRIGGIAEAYRQVRPYASDMAAVATIDDWLTARAKEQLSFWEKEATTGARTGNLRAWAALALQTVGEVTGDEGLSWWAEASAVRILCTARADGSLPQETKRGAYGLHYQFHAAAPLVTIAARAEQAGRPIANACGGALERVVAYAFEDHANGGSATEGYSGKPQSYFDGTETLEPHEQAFLPAFVFLFPNSPLAARLSDLPSASNSKLGGDQRLLWQAES